MFNNLGNLSRVGIKGQTMTNLSNCVQQLPFMALIFVQNTGEIIHTYFFQLLPREASGSFSCASLPHYLTTS